MTFVLDALCLSYRRPLKIRDFVGELILRSANVKKTLNLNFCSSKRIKKAFHFAIVFVSCITGFLGSIAEPL